MNPRLPSVRSIHVVGLLVVLAALQGAYNATVPLMGDEAYYWTWSRHLALSYFDHPPMIAWLLHAATFITASEFTVRLVPLVCFSLTAWLIWKLSDEIDGPRAAVITLVIFLLMPATQIGAFAAVPDAPLMLCWTTALYAGHRILKSRDARWPLLTGLAIGLALLSKYTAILFPVALLIFLGIYRRDLLRRPTSGLAALVALAVFSPVLLWNARHDWLSFAFQLRHGGGDGTGIDWHQWFEFIGGTIGVFSPILFIAAFLAAIRAARGEDLSRRYLAFFCLFPLAFFTYKGLFRKMELNWVAIAFPAATVLVGAYIAERRLYKTFGAGIALALALSVAIKFPLAVGLPAKLNPFNRFYANRIAAETLLAQRQPGEALLADHYTTAALLSFYAPDHPDVQIPTTTRLSQFDLWAVQQPPATPRGLYLTTTRQGGPQSCSELEWKCGEATPLQTLAIEKPGYARRNFRLYRCGH